MRNAPPEAAVARFRNDLTALIGLTTLAGECPQRLALAVSGGPDSLALLILASHAGFDCAAATVDHGLRPESAAEADFVGDLCAELGVPHTTLVLDAPGKGNLSDWARKARYAALSDWADAEALTVLLTAHHADDQLETIIMRLNRGSGVAGLSGIRARRGAIVRPLLSWRKTELEALVHDCGIVAMDDATNRDDRFDRARLRKALANADWLDPIAATQSASALAEAEDALAWTATAYENRRVGVQNGVISFDPRDLPREILRRIILACLRQISPDAEPRGDALDRLISALQRGQVVTLSGVKCTGGAFWLFGPAPVRQKI
jgi:tRNA(Ile)-lysidine synthase